MEFKSNYHINHVWMVLNTIRGGGQSLNPPPSPLTMPLSILVYPGQPLIQFLEMAETFLMFSNFQDIKWPL